MSKIHLDRLGKKYQGKVTGSKYESLMTQIIASNSESVSKAILRLSDEALTKQTKRIPKGGKILTLPDITEVLPKKSVFSRKAAEKGKLLTDNLRNKITNDLREVLDQPNYIRQKGKFKGQLKASVISDFEKKITDTFTNYTKRDPKFGVPKNIHAIAVTETRAVTNNIKDEYMNAVINVNPDTVLYKTWIHNTSLVKEPRKHHERLNGKSIKNEQSFLLKNKKTNQSYTAKYPHDPSLPPGEVIACQCECIYEIRRKEK